VNGEGLPTTCPEKTIRLMTKNIVYICCVDCQAVDVIRDNPCDAPRRVVHAVKCRGPAHGTEHPLNGGTCSGC
jgi:hypothetical protein